MLDSLAERYKMLPSQVLENATTLDLWVYDVAVSYRIHAEKKANAPKGSVPDISEKDLLKGLEKFHESKNRS